MQWQKKWRMGNLVEVLRCSYLNQTSAAAECLFEAADNVVSCGKIGTPPSFEWSACASLCITKSATAEAPCSGQR